jgi:proteasome lid subunit RPN8/RPN11
MRWTEQTPALPLQTLAALAERAPGLDARLRSLDARGGLLIAVSRIALETVNRHLVIRDDEQGGLLIGEVHAEGNDAARSRVVRIMQAVPSLEFASTGVSLRMESGVWEEARRRLGEQQMIVGWYHSHPGLGAFFSDTDRRTQRAFFPHAYSVGWVIDPVLDDAAWFVGPDSALPACVVHDVSDDAEAGGH